MDASTVQVSKSRGRPISAEVDEAVVRATLELLAEVSFAGLSMETVARRAGVGKPSMYRRWPSKAALVTDVISRTVAPVSIDPDGDLREQLRRAVLEPYRGIAGSPAAHVIYSIVGEAMMDPQLAVLFREGFVEPRRRFIEDALRRGADAGVIRADLDVRLIHHMFVGPLMHGWVLDGVPMSQDAAEVVFDEVWAAISRHSS